MSRSTEHVRELGARGLAQRRHVFELSELSIRELFCNELLADMRKITPARRTHSIPP